MKNTFYEFFAGGGMAPAGLGRGWECLLANDFSKKKADAYAANWGGHSLWVGDIAAIKPEQLPGQADLAWASFACQDLSLAGNGAGLDGNRSGTLWAFLDVIASLQKQGRKPRIIALEKSLRSNFKSWWQGLRVHHPGKSLIKATSSERW